MSWDDDIVSVKSGRAHIKKDMAILKWMVSALYPVIIAILLKLFLH